METCCQLKAKAVGLGLAEVEAESILSGHGSKVMELVVEALTDGLSVHFVKEVLDLLGPFSLGMAVGQLKATKLKTKFGGPLPIIEGEKVFDSALTDLLVDMVIKLLPDLLKQFGPVILEAVVNALVNSLKNDKSKIEKAVKSAMLA